MSRTIGFFGDSFCAELSNAHSIRYNYTSYIKLVADHYTADIVNLGQQGSSIYDSILIQMAKFPVQLPDISIFVWTHPGRLFHRQQRNMNIGTVTNNLVKDRRVQQAAKQYYEHLYDWDKEQLTYVSTLQYVDQVLLPKYKDQSRIVHLWSFGDWAVGHDTRTIKYPYTWQTGSEIRPALAAVSYWDCIEDSAANHLMGNTKNNLVANWIKTAVDTPGYSQFNNSVN